MAESVDALVSNTNDSNVVPVRPRLWVHSQDFSIFSGSLFVFEGFCRKEASPLYKNSGLTSFHTYHIGRSETVLSDYSPIDCFGYDTINSYFSLTQRIVNAYARPMSRVGCTYDLLNPRCPALDELTLLGALFQ